MLNIYLDISGNMHINVLVNVLLNEKIATTHVCTLDTKLPLTIFTTLIWFDNSDKLTICDEKYV